MSVQILIFLAFLLGVPVIAGFIWLRKSRGA